MFRLSEKMADELILDDVTYPLDLSFDNVLIIFDMLNDDSVDDVFKPYIALNRLTGIGVKELAKMLPPKLVFETFKKVFDDCIAIKHSNAKPSVDLQGNMMPEVKKEDDDEAIYSIKYDAEYIYASFMQAYGIDLFDVQGQLHWKKFNALLVGLPDGTKLTEVMKIRAWRPSKGETVQEKAQKRKLQRLYALPKDD